ncbi:hypothetical protein WMY93_004681 [Mugilogobius chulae]|uniref:Immunoglobulin domain-containing protein n=1 Tax=Mugilogobius chulae TaxID=88201 RepID=A0AAW0Q478_9GOBI
MLKLGLLVLLLQVFSFAQEDWTISAPSQVSAVSGSCVVIPCSYSFPQTHRKIKNYLGIWKRSGDQMNVASSRANYPLHVLYRGRTRFLGAVWKKKCTWVLERLRGSDTGLYFFRIELPEFKSFSWTSQPTKLQVVDVKPPQLDLSSAEEPADSGEPGFKRKFLAFCSLVHSCPIRPPVFSWSLSEGVQLSGVQQLDQWHWLTYSSVSFSLVNNRTVSLSCTASYPGGQQVSSTVQVV